jgi:hypothetical protein
MWQLIGKYALKAALYALGHQDVITHTVADAKAKNLSALVMDAGEIAAGVKGQ